MRYLTEPFDSKRSRDAFSCGKGLLDNYFWTQAKQDVKRKLSACFVLVDNETGKISGYYTLSSNSISNDMIPESFKKKLPKSYLSIPTVLLGRLAIDKDFQGKGIGKLLLIDSLKRCYDASKSVGSFAVIVDPLDKEAERFYEKYGFINLPDSGKMFLPMKTIEELFE
ncbi:GNAT family N-acetyltransferase [Alkalitalea saponilacus]|uniref:Acetyltransferase (GNAT) domain-containing protein n=1 Tax=Alkalitalea saponilacus TaxID=889453 RepID=A0A1T5HTQ1_9BACT|nr:GNAT family N-acetyltransferase [Alkalitalea saponilacus]ASB49943.1 GNAT family N-acetyltransferase [Alkalitalea saponilacus]SKC24012.1 Acetyltransferase (GNAT) domain-containing protein [Alkalitalea saponilacus]